MLIKVGQQKRGRPAMRWIDTKIMATTETSLEILKTSAKDQTLCRVHSYDRREPETTLRQLTTATTTISLK